MRWGEVGVAGVSEVMGMCRGVVGGDCVMWVVDCGMWAVDCVMSGLWAVVCGMWGVV